MAETSPGEAQYYYEAHDRDPLQREYGCFHARRYPGKLMG